MNDYEPNANTITVDLFAQEMKYLHDNGFRVLLLNQVGFDPTKNVFYLKNTLFHRLKLFLHLLTLHLQNLPQEQYQGKRIITGRTPVSETIRKSTK